MAVYRPTYRDQKTGEKKQQAVWWYNFTFDGQRICASTKTALKTIAIEAEKSHRRRLENARAGMPAEAAPSDRIKAVKDRLAEYEREFSIIGHKQRSVDWVKERVPHLRVHFGGALVADLTKERMVNYMVARRGEGAGNRTINMEVGILARALGHTWRLLWPKLKHLDESTDIGRALTWAETDKLLEAAARNKSPFIRLVILIALQTGMRIAEIRGLCWKQIDWERDELVVDKSKTEAGRRRPIPLNPTLHVALEMHQTWYVVTLGKSEPGWFLFPQCNRLKPADPTRHITSVKSAWGSVRKAAGVQCRFHDLRHTACSRMASAGKSKEDIMAIMGHVSSAIFRRYYHVSAESRREAVLALEQPPARIPPQRETAVKESAKVERFGRVQ